ncbi:MAG TPA: hypothetical protein VEH53_01425 [archaeon]|nr:hypothetical protein [archaeon]
MKVICAYCERDGAPALIGEKEPRDNPMITHGICPRHRRELQQEIEGLAIRVTLHVASLRPVPEVTVQDRPDRALSQDPASRDQGIQA